MNLGLVLAGTTLNRRLERAIVMIRALASKRWSAHAKIKLIQGLILPLSFYGSEVAPPAESLVTRLASAIASAIAPFNASTTNAISFMTATGHCLEPGGVHASAENQASQEAWSETS